MRELGIERSRGTRNFGSGIQSVDHQTRIFQQILNRTTLLILHINFKSTAYAIAGNHRLCKSHNLCRRYIVCTFIYFIDNGIYFIFIARPFVPGFQTNDKHTVRCPLTANHTITCHLREYTNLRNILDTPVDFVHYNLSLLQIRSGRSTYIYKNSSHILLRHKSGFRRFHQNKQSGASNYQQYTSQPFMFKHKKHSCFIFHHDTMKCRIKCHMETRRKTHFASFSNHVRGHNQSAQCRT